MNSLILISTLSFGLIFSGSLMIPAALVGGMMTNFEDSRFTGMLAFGTFFFVFGISINP